MSESNLNQEIRGEYIISGRVQGVGYRYFVLQAAYKYNIRGRIKNLSNGTVRVRAIGSDLQSFENELWQGSVFSTVEQVKKSELPESLGYADFSIE
ncbi:MAG: acylphosphatase [Candidatus Stygibacter australis]|nr:acylphosphatase [Candidatus Stygibacter australis]MDP8321007.1 acylphosphatase [Candidatus Stygibacter australis]